MIYLYYTMHLVLGQNPLLGLNQLFGSEQRDFQCMYLYISATKNPHSAGARTVPALYGCGPHSNLIFKGHWTLIFRKNLKKKFFFFPVFFTFLQSIQKIITLLNHIFFRTLFLLINFGCGCEYGCAQKHSQNKDIVRVRVRVQKS